MTKEVHAGSKVKASDINQLVKAANNPQISVVGQGIRSSSIGGAMTISQDTPLKGDANASLPQLFSIKAGPSKKWQQKDGNGKIYPSLYVYLGPSPALALETVNISDNLIADGDHPHIFMYFNLSKAANWRTHAYPINEQTGQPETNPFDPVPDSMSNVRGCMIDSTDNSLDGWYELPTSPVNAMPIWACCFLTFGEIPVLAFCTVNEIKTPITNSNSLSTVEMSSFEPDLSDLGTKLAALDSNLKMYGGLIGSPIKMYDLNPYSTDDLDHKFDQNGKVNAGYDWITLYSASNRLTFSNTSDKAANSFKPFCTGRKGSNGQWIYGFYLSLPYPKDSPARYPGGGNPYGPNAIGASIQQDTMSEGGSTLTVITLPQFETLGNNKPIRLAYYEGPEKEAVGQNVTITITTPDQEPPLTPKGSLMGLTIVPDGEWDISTYGLTLIFLPMMVSCTNSIVYLPKVLNSTIGWTRAYSVKFISDEPMFRACTIYPAGGTESLSYSNLGNVPHFTGDGAYMKYGLLTPPYESAPLLSLVKATIPDCAIQPTFDQLQNGVVVGSWDYAPGLGSNQFASIMYDVCTKNWSTDHGENWQIDNHVPSISFLELYGFNRFDIDRKVNFYPEETVEGIEVVGTGNSVRKDFDFVIRKRCESYGDESEGANIAYMRGFVPDTVLDEGQQKCRTIQFYEGTLEKDGVTHTALSLYDFHLASAMPVVFNENCKKLSEGYGNRGNPNELNMVARYWQGTEQEINYLDLDFTWIVDSLTACIEGLGPYYPSGGGGGIQELGQAIDELSAKCDLDYGDFWVRGRDYNYNYGTSIGDHTQALVINLTDKELQGQWACNDDFTAMTVLKVNQAIEFYGQGPIQIVDNNGDTYFPDNSLITEYDVATEAYTSDSYKHLTATFGVLDSYTQQTADQIKALHDLIKAQATTIQNQATTIQSLQTAVQTLQQTVANHEQRLQNGGL